MFVNKLKVKIRTIMALRRTLPPFLYWKKKFKSDPLFNMSNIEKGLLPHLASTSSSKNSRVGVAERILAAYHFAARDQEKQPSVYKVSNEWIPIFRKPLQPLLEALDRGDAKKLSDLLDNFFRSPISVGLIGLATNMATNFFENSPSRYLKYQLLIDSVYRYRLLQKLIPGVQPKDLYIEDIGNPYGLYVDGEFTRTGVDYQYYYAYYVAQLLEINPNNSVVAELGGGIGGFAYFLNKLRSSRLTYINLDLPEILCISSYQLLNLYPDKNVLLYGERDQIDSEVISKYDIALLPSFMIECIGDNSVDVSFNSYSLAEMDANTVTNYATQLSRISSNAILHVNHVSDSLIGADQFPFDYKKFKLISRTRAEWNLGRNLHCDEYEFLLKRKGI